jgi:hypothetical protein
VALLLQPLDRHYSNVVGSRWGRGVGVQQPPYGPPQQVRPPFTPPSRLCPSIMVSSRLQHLRLRWHGPSWLAATNSFNTMALVPPALTDWVADSSASKHTTSDAGNLTFICSPHTSDPSSIIVGNRFSLLITSVGDMTLPDPFYLNNVLVTPDIIQNLLSVRRFTTNNWCSMEFDPFGLSVKDLSTRNVITRCNSSGPLYTMRMPSCSTHSSSATTPTALVASASTWHHRLGHPGVDVMSELSNASSVICSRRTHDLCHPCQLGHHTHMLFVSSASHADNNFNLIHCDLWT